MSIVDDDTNTDEPGRSIDEEDQSPEERAQRERDEHREADLDKEDEAVDESFPASDPPAY